MPNLSAPSMLSLTLCERLGERKLVLSVGHQRKGDRRRQDILPDFRKPQPRRRL